MIEYINNTPTDLLRIILNYHYEIMLFKKYNNVMDEFKLYINIIKWVIEDDVDYLIIKKLTFVNKLNKNFFKKAKPFKYYIYSLAPNNFLIFL